MDVDDVAAELYGIAPEDFVKERDARATAAREAGDAAGSKAIKALRRPSTSAWLANLLVRERRDQVAQLLDLGSQLREAQQQLAGEQLRALSQQRQHVVSALGHEARKLAAGLGHPVSDDVQRELEGTLHAAMSDPDAAEAVRSGRLTSALHYAGLGAGLDPAAVPQAVSGPSKQELEKLEKSERELAAAEDRHSELRERIVGLQQQLDELRTADTAAAKEVRAAKKARDAAARALQHAPPRT